MGGGGGTVEIVRMAFIANICRRRRIIASSFDFGGSPAPVKSVTNPWICTWSVSCAPQYTEILLFRLESPIWCVARVCQICHEPLDMHIECVVSKSVYKDQLPFRLELSSLNHQICHKPLDPHLKCVMHPVIYIDILLFQLESPDLNDHICQEPLDTMCVCFFCVCVCA